MTDTVMTVADKISSWVIVVLLILIGAIGTAMYTHEAMEDEREKREEFVELVQEKLNELRGFQKQIKKNDSAALQNYSDIRDLKRTEQRLVDELKQVTQISREAIDKAGAKIQAHYEEQLDDLKNFLVSELQNLEIKYRKRTRHP